MYCAITSYLFLMYCLVVFLVFFDITFFYCLSHSWEVLHFESVGFKVSIIITQKQKSKSANWNIFSMLIHVYKYQQVSVKIRLDVIMEDSNKTEVSAAHDLTDQLVYKCLAGTYCIRNFTDEYLCRHHLENKSLNTYIRFE